MSFRMYFLVCMLISLKLSRIAKWLCQFVYLFGQHDLIAFVISANYECERGIVSFVVLTLVNFIR